MMADAEGGHMDEVPLALVKVEEKPGLWSGGRTVGPFGSTSFSLDEARTIAERLNENLTKAETCTRPGPGGVRLTYIEGWKVIQEANLLFGFNGWTQTVLSTDVRFIEETPGGRYSVCVSALVRVTLRDGSAREDRGGGTCDGMRSKGDALLKAEKEAITDATKRALKNFGPRLGLCLYDKLSVREMNRQPPRGMPPSGWTNGAHGQGPPHHGRGNAIGHQGRPNPAPPQRGVPQAPHTRAQQQHRQTMAKQEQYHAQLQSALNLQHKPTIAPAQTHRSPNTTTGCANRNVSAHRNAVHPNVSLPLAPPGQTGYVNRNVTGQQQNTSPNASISNVTHQLGIVPAHQQRMPSTSGAISNRDVKVLHQAAPKYATVPSNTDTPQRNAAPVAVHSHQNVAVPHPQRAPYVPSPGALPGNRQQRNTPINSHHRPQSAPTSRRTSLPAPGTSRNQHLIAPQNGGTIIQGNTNTAQQTYNRSHTVMHVAPGQGQPAKAYAASPVTPAGPRRSVGGVVVGGGGVGASGSRPTPPSRSGNLLCATPSTEAASTRAQPVGNARVLEGYVHQQHQDQRPQGHAQGGAARMSRPNGGLSRAAVAQYAGTKRPNCAVAGPATQQRQRRQRAAVVQTELAELQNMGPEHFS